MVKRINALRIVFNFFLSLVELLIGVRFLINIFSSANEPTSELIKLVNASLEQMGYATTSIFQKSGFETSVSFLILVLSFMFISFILITIVPAMTIRKERELEMEDYEL